MKTFQIMFALLVSSLVYAQQATEQYIPLGSSPGLSDNKAQTGKIESFSPAGAVLTIESHGIQVAAEITSQTRIWLDRSGLKLPNLRGAPSDLQAGRRCEVRFQELGSRKAEWVKVEITEP